MTNQTILKLFDLLCNEARNTLHSTLGLMETHADRANHAPGESCNGGSSRMKVDRLLRLIDDLRELFSADHQFESAAEEFDVSIRVGETVELLNLARGDVQSLLLWETPPPPLMIRQSADALDQALAPILDLTLKFSRHGAARIRLAPGEEDGTRLLITPPNSELVEQLVKWLRADPDQAAFENGDDVAFGVPLLVAGKRLRALGGSVSPADGAKGPPSLELSLPSLAPAHQPWPDPGPREALSILIVEDCDDSYVLAQVLLKKESLLRAKTGLEAIDMAKQRRFDVIFMDIHMPGMDGYGAIRAIREWETQTANARTPIVVLSSDEIGTQARSAAESGCSGFLRKPVRPREMYDLLDRLRAARAPAF